MTVLDIGLWIAIFLVALFALTFTTALIADISGLFRLLFIQKPYRQGFRLLRWLVAGLAAAGVLAAIE